MQIILEKINFPRSRTITSLASPKFKICAK